MDLCTNRAYSVGIIVIMTCVQIRTYPNYKHRLRTEQSGFLYGDALMAVTLVLLILPIILYVLSSTLSIVKTTYTHDYILLRFSVQAIDNGVTIYEISTFLGPSHR